MKIVKIIINTLAFIIGVGLVVLGQNGALLANVGVARNSLPNLGLQLVGVAIILVLLYLYNKGFTKYDVKKSKKK